MAKNIKFLSGDGLSYLWDEIRERLFLKVDKIDGKSLSTNDYTDSEKEKLSNIETGSQVNVVENISVNGTNQANSNKTVNISVPTSVSQLTNDSNYQTESQVNSRLALKVDKVTGKSLTTNDFSNDYKTKLDGIESGSQVNNIDNINVNGTRLNVANKTVNITVPTNISELNNDSNYQTSSDVTTAINTAIGNVIRLTKEVVVTLPSEGADNVIYLVPNGKLGSNTKDEYMWINGGWEKIGSSDVDLSGYVQTSDTITNSQIDTIVG